MSFECPPNSEIYFDQIVNRCRAYVRMGIWTIDATALDGWLSNFVSAEEKHLAACLLDKAIFRDEAQVRAMILQLLQRTLSDALAAPNEFGIDWQMLLSDSNQDPAVRIVPVIRDLDSPAKSGPLVARLYRRLGGVADEWMIWPWLIRKHVKAGIRCLLLIDDFVGSGKQFTSFAKRFRLDQLRDVKIVYAPLIAHPEGITAIRESHPGILVVPGEILSADTSVLPETGKSSDGHNTNESARVAYRAYWTRRAIRLQKKMLFGWEGLNLGFAFNHGTPNASLPLFWLDHDSHKALFAR